jgi:ribosomal protein L22
MKEEKQRPKKVLHKAKEILDKTANRKRIEFIVTYEVEGSRSKKQKVHAYSKEEAEEMMTKKLQSQISSGEINGFKITSVEIENPA